MFLYELSCPWNIEWPAYVKGLCIMQVCCYKERQQYAYARAQPKTEMCKKFYLTSNMVIFA